AAYVIYTSGSTGRPKGVLNTHRGIVNRLLWMQSEYGLSDTDSVLQKTPYSFDVSVWEFFWPLQVGARLVVAEPGGHRDSGYLASVINEQQISTVHFVPSMLRLFLEDARAASCTSLRRVVCSGEALTFDLQQRFFEVFPARVELHNLYGPTEAAVDVTYWQCDSADTSGVVPIGRPVANTQMHVLDEQLSPVPIGVAGELHIGGVQVARGYVNRPELTAERFIDDPFGDGRLYKTGDLARWRRDGNLEFLGRTDHQVKIRGNRVELGEIEAVLLQHPRLATCAVTTRAQANGSLQLIAHFSASADVPTSGELRAFLHAKLPGYMVPNVFVKHDAFTLTTSGKIDRKELDAALAAQGEPETEYVGPRDPLEQLIADIWIEVLGRERVGVLDRFFEIGGDSIQAAEFVNRVQRELDEFIYVITAFTAPTIAEYAELLRREYPEAVASRLDESPEANGRSASGKQSRTMDDKLAALRSAVPTFAPFDGWAQGPANSRAIFVLSPPRSGTSLLRVMLAGHPDLFAGSELQLLTFDTLEQRRAVFDGRFSLWREGTIRSIMELKGVDAAAASSLMDEHEREGLSAKHFYGVLQEWARGRLLVDKSPSYALDRGALDNAEVGFDKPFYIHLVRDPHEMVHSFASYHMDQVLFLEDHGFRAEELGELVWLQSHLTTLEFLDGVPSERQFRLRFEDLVAEPRGVVERLAEALGIKFHEGLVTPYADLDRKMVDGLYESSTPMGDTRFLEHGRIDAAVATKWRTRQPADVLAAETWALARRFGYAAPAGSAPEPGRSRRDLAAQQRRRRAARP
ncbi:MAG: amino acid adenylation domain-containing protein, partial [Gaiellaceae bacterium]